jgi:hypothetical protein
MSEQCSVCGESDELLHDCNYCKRAYCSEHTLPEKHDCAGLKQAETDGNLIPDNTKNISGADSSVQKPDIERIGGDKNRAQQGGSKDREHSPEPLSDDEITTYGGGKGEFDSSPDVAADGSLKSKEHNKVDQSHSERGIIQKLISVIKFWS